MKFDGQKIRMSLVPWKAIERIATVLTFGALKYEPRSWQNVPNGVERYTDAFLRHISAWQQGEDIDSDSGLHHLDHALCCLVFVVCLSDNLPQPDWDAWTKISEKYAKDRAAVSEESIRKALEQCTSKSRASMLVPPGAP